MKKKILFIMAVSFFVKLSSVSAASKVSCGNITEIPAKIPELTSFFITVLQIAVPVIIVLMGTIDLFKGISSSKEDEMKKGQHMFVKRLIVGVLVFFIVALVRFIISLVSNEENTKNMVGCIDCFISNKCDEYKIEPFTCDISPYHLSVDESQKCNIATEGTNQPSGYRCDYVPKKKSDCDKVGIRLENNVVITYKK